MSLRKVLLQSNLDLLREIEQLLKILQNASNSIPIELYTYCQWVIAAFQAFYSQVNQNLNDLALGHDAILLDILSNTQKIRQYLCLFNQRLFSPILRTQPSDRLCLKLLQWLHSAHPQTQKIPLAFIDGDFASWSAKSLDRKSVV